MTDVKDDKYYADRSSRAYPLNHFSPHATDILDKGERTAFCLVNLVGSSADYVSRIMETAKSVAAKGDMIPVFVTDLTDLNVFRKQGVIVEAVPPIGQSAMLMPRKDWAARQAECLALINDKWRPRATVDLSTGVPRIETK